MNGGRVRGAVRKQIRPPHRPPGDRSHHCRSSSRGTQLGAELLQPLRRAAVISISGILAGVVIVGIIIATVRVANVAGAGAGVVEVYKEALPKSSVVV